MTYRGLYIEEIDNFRLYYDAHYSYPLIWRVYICHAEKIDKPLFFLKGFATEEEAYEYINSQLFTQPTQKKKANEQLLLFDKE